MSYWRLTQFQHDGRDFTFAVSHPRDYVQYRLVRGTFYALEELQMVRRHVGHAKCIVDVGANIGNHSVYLAAFTECVSIVPVEPNPMMAPVLKANLAMNCAGKVCWDHIGIGLGKSRATASIDITDPMNLGATRLSMKGGGGGSIEVHTGDERFAGLKVDLIKIDVEGMELDVLTGLEGTIARCRPALFVEVEHANRTGFEDMLRRWNYMIVETSNRYTDVSDVLAKPRTQS